VAGAERERGLMVLESLSYFEGRDEQDLWVDLFDPHPNREGHKVLARASGKTRHARRSLT